jgi:hypothetical protein
VVKFTFLIKNNLTETDIFNQKNIKRKDKKSELTELKRIINLYKLTEEIAMLLNELDKAYLKNTVVTITLI